MNVPASWYLILAAVLFGVGAFGFLTRRSAIIMFMCIELMLNAVNLTFVTFARSLSDTFAGIAPVSVPGFMVSQIAGALIALGAAKALFPSKDIA